MIINGYHLSCINQTNDKQQDDLQCIFRKQDESQKAEHLVLAVFVLIGLDIFIVMLETL